MDAPKQPAPTTTDHEQQVTSDHQLRKSTTTHYFTNASRPELQALLPGSEFVTRELAELVAIAMPHRIVSKGWRLAFSRARDGTSYDQ